MDSTVERDKPWYTLSGRQHFLPVASGKAGYRAA